MQDPERAPFDLLQHARTPAAPQNARPDRARRALRLRGVARRVRGKEAEGRSLKGFVITPSKRRICRIVRENGLESACTGRAPWGGARPARGRSFASEKRLRFELFDWVNWYNGFRLHSTLSYMTPVALREADLILS